jgi:hypothetical protein
MMIGLSRCDVLAIGAVARMSLALGRRSMRAPRHDRILASTALSLLLVAPLGALAQDSNEAAATFNERFSIEQTSTPPSAAVLEAEKERSVTRAKRVVAAKRPRSRVGAWVGTISHCLAHSFPCRDRRYPQALAFAHSRKLLAFLSARPVDRKNPGIGRHS